MDDIKRIVEIETGREGTVIDETPKSYVVKWDDSNQTTKVRKNKTGDA